MEALVGFVVGYLVGTRSGRQGLIDFVDAVEEIQESSEFKAMRSMALSSFRQTVANAGKASALTAAGGATSMLESGVRALASWAREGAPERRAVSISSHN